MRIDSPNLIGDITAASISNALGDAITIDNNNIIRRRTLPELLTDINAEPAFTKNTAFNKNFGTSSGTVVEGNDPRVLNGQTAFGWGNHALAGYVTLGSNQTITGLKSFEDAIRIDGQNSDNFSYLGFKQSAGGSVGDSGYTSIYPNLSNGISFRFSQSLTNNDEKSFTFNVDNIPLNNSREYLMPNASGTIALTNSGTLNFIPKFTPNGTSLGNSLLFDNGVNVGIGNTNPDTKLHIQGVSSNNITNITSISGIRIDGNISDTSSTGITFQSGGGGGAGYLLGRDGSFGTFLSFYTNPTTNAVAGAMTERMRINPDGSVGILTNNPVNALSLGDVGSIGQDVNSLYVGANFTSTGINFRKTGNFSQQIHFDTAEGSIFFKNTSSSGTVGNTITYLTRMRIASNGAVTINNLSGTGSGIVGTDASGNLIRYTIGSGLTLTGTTLTASGGSTTGLTGSGTANIISMWSGATSLTNSVISQDTADNRITITNSLNGIARLVVVNTNTGTSATAFNYASTTGNRYLGFVVGGANRTGTTAGLSNASLSELQSGGDSSAMLIHAGGNYPMVFAINQSEVMRIASNGRVLINSTSDNGYLAQINGGISLNAKSLISQNAYFVCEAIGYRFNNSTDTFNNVIMYDNGNMFVRRNVLIGTTTDSGTSQKLQVYNSGTSNYLRLATDNGAFDSAVFHTDGTNSVYGGMMRGTTGLVGAYTIYTGGAGRLNVLSNGRTLINSTADNGLGQLQVTGNITASGYYKSGRLGYYGTYNSAQVQGIWSISENFPISIANNNFGSAYGMAYAYSTAGGAPIVNQHQVLFVDEGIWGVSISFTGEIRAKGDIVAFSSSDKRLKDNLVYIENSLEKINKLGGYSFTWNNNQETYTGNDYGVVAQEVEALFPEMVTTRDNGYKAVKYDRLIPVMIEAIKELSNKVSKLEGGK